MDNSHKITLCVLYLQIHAQIDVQIQLSYFAEFTGLSVDGNRGLLELSLPDRTGVEIIFSTCLTDVSKSRRSVQDSRRVCLYTFSILSNLLASLPAAIKQSDWSVRSLEWEAIVSNVAESSPRLKNRVISVLRILRRSKYCG